MGILTAIGSNKPIGVGNLPRRRKLEKKFALVGLNEQATRYSGVDTRGVLTWYRAATR